MRPPIGSDDLEDDPGQRIALRDRSKRRHARDVRGATELDPCATEVALDAELSPSRQAHKARAERHPTGDSDSSIPLHASSTADAQRF
jgi:hypothetical protein